MGKPCMFIMQILLFGHSISLQALPKIEKENVHLLLGLRLLLDAHLVLNLGN